MSEQPPVEYMPVEGVSRRLDAAADSLRDRLASLSRRLAWIAAGEGAAAGLAVAAVLAALVWRGSGRVMPPIVAGILLGALGVVVRTLGRKREPGTVAALIETHAPASRNVVVTATELLDRPVRIRPDVSSRVLREADRIVETINPAQLLPAGRTLAALGIAALLWVIALMVITARPASSVPAVDVPVTALSIDGVDVTVTPPGYSGRASQSLSDPARIDALAGSRIRVAVRAMAASVALETIGGGEQALAPGDARTFSGDVAADADGFIAIEARASDGRPGLRRLIGLTVTPDRPPRVRITTPGRDLFIPEARGAIDLAVEADDDLALASLRMRYTKVSGSGERFTFTEGETPLAITRASAQAWRARGSLPIEALELGAGDVIVYRGVATDRRPGAPPTESDAFIVEITAPGATPSEGFAADDELDRNAVSQQMVILKTERLLERRSTISAETFTEEARTIAAEQRRVRAEFVFMMGGELADEVTGATGISELNEEEEAEAGDDILAGRLANRGRVELVRAIRSMSLANAKLTAMDVGAALEDEKRALDHLQNAFSRTRYILRTLTLRERLDLTRRLTGELADASRTVRPVPEAEPNPRAVALRAALAGVAELASAAARGNLEARESVRASMLAQAVLRVDPASAAMQGVAEHLSAAGDAIHRGQMPTARVRLDRATLALATIVRAALVTAPPRAASLELRELDGALGDALRRAGSPP